MTVSDIPSTPSTFSAQGVVAAEDAQLSQLTQNLQKEIQAKFAGLVESVVGKIDEMATRIEELERTVNEMIVASSPAQE